MNCPKCGSEIQEGHLYCEKCGEEIIIVSEVDGVLDENIRQNLASVVNDELNNKKGLLTITREFGLTKDLAELKKTRPADISSNNEVKSINTKLIIALAILAIVVLVLTIFISNSISSYVSYEKQYEQALEYFDEGKYEESVKKIKRVISKSPDEFSPKLLLCDNYYEMGKYDEALAVLEKLMIEYPSDMNVYERLVKNYEAKGDSDAISKLISDSSDDSVKFVYGDYTQPSVNFSPNGGTYDETQFVVLSSDMEGEIYYTIDGSEPSENSLRYYEPIEISSGEVTIKAISINAKGVRSGISEMKYVIDFVIPEMPQLDLMPGQFTSPSLVSVTVTEGEKCYFTIDGEDPTEESEEYSGPIPMYIGTHIYKFACISDKGISSEVVEAEYVLDIVNLVNMGTAVDNLCLLLNTRGITTNDKTYKCEQACVVNGVTYYIINEYEGNEISSATPEGDTDIIDKKTGNIYAVDVITGLTFKAIFDKESGTYSLSAF